MTERLSGVKASIGFASETGPRERNEDFAGAVFGMELPQPRRDVVAAIADGIGGAKGGRVAAEMAVRGFLDGFCDLPETMEVRRAGAQILKSLNGWIHSQGQRDAKLAGMGCTFTALVLRGRVVHLLHVGDTRAYRLRGDRLVCLTNDHVRESAAGAGRSSTLVRALGVETEVPLDYSSQPLARHDRFLLCSDGVHAFLTAEAIADILRERSASEDSARAIVAAALQAGSTDNCTALVVDVVELPTAESADIGAAIMQLPLIPVPIDGETVDGFVLKVLMSDGRYTRLFGAFDEIEGGEVALKFPKPQVAAVATYRAAFVREAWVGARVHSPWVGRTIELPPGRQTCLYTVMPLYQGELLETRLVRRPSIGLEEGRNIAIKLARAVAALHHAGIIHRDIKPDNVILETDGSLKLIDLGVVRVPGLEDFPPADIPGTPGYMAPEMFAGEPGNEATDIYSLGVTMFRAFTGAFPYGNPDATTPARRSRPAALSTLRPDLPAWLQAVLARAIAVDPAERFRDVTEFAVEMETGPARAPLGMTRPQTLYERSPVRFWQGVSVLLALALLASLLLRH
jgi:serine/threonine protein phosphatase PrpC